MHQVSNSGSAMSFAPNTEFLKEYTQKELQQVIADAKNLYTQRQLGNGPDARSSSTNSIVQITRRAQA